MKLGKLSVLSAAALLAGGMSFAVAQSNMAPAGSLGRVCGARASAGTMPSNQIKDKGRARHQQRERREEARRSDDRIEADRQQHGHCASGGRGGSAELLSVS